MDVPLVSLYNDTFPDTTGVFNTSHASAIPFVESINC